MDRIRFDLPDKLPRHQVVRFAATLRSKVEVGPPRELPSYRSRNANSRGG